MVTKKDKYLAAAQKYMERGQLDKALAEFGRVVHEDPKDTRTWLRMAEIHAKRGQNEQATEIYRKTADIYSEQGFLQKAVAVWKNVLKLSPGYLDGYTRLAELFAQLGQMREATEQVELLAAAHQRAGRAEEALAAMRRIVELDPENVISRIKLAEAASQAGATADAVREFAIAADQLRSQGRTEDYLRVAERLFFHQPDNLPLARELAETYIIRNNARLALPKLQACFKADPRDPGTLSLLARAFEQLGQIPKTVSVLKELAKLCHEQGRTAERNRAIRKAMSLDPRDADLNETAERWGIGSDAPRATSAAAPVVPTPPRRPSHTQVTRSLPKPEDDDPRDEMDGPRSGVQADIARIMAESEVFIKYGLLERAVEHLRRVLDIDATYLAARTKRADVLVDLGRNADAVAELEEAAEAVATSAPGDAAALARRVLVLDPGSMRAQRMLQALLVPETTPAPVVRQGDAGRPAASPQTAPASAGRAAHAGLAAAGPASPPMTAARPAATPAAPPAPAARTTVPVAREAVPELRRSGDDRVTAPRPVIAAIPIKPAAPEAAADEMADDAFDAPVSSGGSLPSANEVPSFGAGRGVPLSSMDESSSFPPSYEAQPDAPLPMDVNVSTGEVVELDSQEIQEAIEEELSGTTELPADPSAVLAGQTPGDVVTADVTARVTVDEADGVLASLADIEGPAAEAPADATAESLDPDLTAELVQVEFFRDQGMWQDALSQLSEMQRRLPDNPILVGKRTELEAEAAAAGFSLEAPLADQVDQVFDGFSSGGFSSGGGSTRPRAVVDGEADLSTHGDLGIAYKEMGLHDAAIAEFQLLTADPGREVFALTMMGECLEAKGAVADAIASYKKALASPRVTATETTQLYFCLGAAFETAGDVKEATYYLERVVKRDASFRDASIRLDKLKRKARQE